MKSLFTYTVSLLTFLSTALAHPVAQGSIDVQILPEKLLLQARVSGEEVFIANTFGNHPSGSAGTLPQVWQRHGQYLLAHFRIIADGRPLIGQIVKVAPAQNDFVLYQFAFPFASPPRDLRIEENVLREIEFAPGNPCEASYIARLRE